MQKIRKRALVGIVPNHVFFFRPIQQSVLPSLLATSERVWCRRFQIRDPAAKPLVGFTNACKGWSQSELVLIGRLSRDAARANLRSRRLGRNHLSCKREHVTSISARKPVGGWFLERRFQPLPRRIFSNKRESISRCPKSTFPSKKLKIDKTRTSIQFLKNTLVLKIRNVSPP